MEIDINELKEHPRNTEIYGEEDVSALSAKILKSGWIKTLVINQDNIIVSGHRRKKAAEILGWAELPCERIETNNENHLLELLLLENAFRDKDNYQRGKEFEAYYEVEREKAKHRQVDLAGTRKTDLRENFPEGHEKDKGRSSDSAAKKAGIGSGKTAETIRDVVHKVDELKETGKEKEAEILKAALNKSASGAKKIMDKDLSLLDESTIEKLKEEKTTIPKLEKEIRQKTHQKKLEKEAEAAKDIELTHELIDFRHGRFLDVLGNIPPGSVDLILTDPPYPKEFIDEWYALSGFAARVLKPGGFCIAYSGQLNLPEVIKALSSQLDYYWAFALTHSGTNQYITPRNLYCEWKPLFIFQNGFSLYKPDKNALIDVITGSGREKENHEWQQGENELTNLIEYFTDVGHTVCDPFAGSGTTLIKAAKMKRKCIGAEMDETHYNNAKKRIENAFK